ncbi:hypothetical protein BKA70DRAFT_1562867 [Coprinopsis sp. MPI-PUGE-AT-0042]|nr:hypothetical protein BKA70DRAFT_1562867 [Coprinopsis sp. MPI-PUGE-AT-0042]
MLAHKPEKVLESIHTTLAGTEVEKLGGFLSPFSHNTRQKWLHHAIVSEEEREEKDASDGDDSEYEQGQGQEDDNNSADDEESTHEDSDFIEDTDSSKENSEEEDSKDGKDDDPDDGGHQVDQYSSGGGNDEGSCGPCDDNGDEWEMDTTDKCPPTSPGGTDMDLDSAPCNSEDETKTKTYHRLRGTRRVSEVASPTNGKMIKSSVETL